MRAAAPIVVGVFLALVLFVGAATLLFRAHEQSRTAVVESLSESHLGLARLLAADRGGPIPRRDLSLRGLDRRWRALESSLPDRFVCVIGRDGQLLYHSANSEMIGRDASAVMLGASRPEGVETVGQLARSGLDWAGENTSLSGRRQIAAYAYDESLDALIAIHVAASVVDARIRATAAPWLTGLGAILALLLPLSIGLCVWGFRRSQRSLRASHESRRRLKEELAHAQKMEAVGRLAGSLAHDFNNFMTAVLGYADVAMGRARGRPDVVAEIGQIKRTVTRAAELTSQLLAIGRRQPRRAEPVDLNAAVADGSRLVRRVVGDDVELVLDLGASPGWTVADTTQIEQVLLNLAVNARDAMPEGGRLTITTTTIELNEDDETRPPSLSPGRYVKLVVTDDGIGMDGETRRRAFEPYFTTKERGRGSGLGLSSVHGIVTQSGGAVRIESDPGHGTEVTVLLQETDERPAAKVTGRIGHERRAASILVAENDESVRDLLKRVLEREGYEVVEARDAVAADQILKRHASHVDLVVTDLNMPGRGGASLARTVVACRPGVPILFISGCAPPEVESLAPTAPSLFLEKPFKPQQLVAAVESLLGSVGGEPSPQIEQVAASNGR